MAEELSFSSKSIINLLKNDAVYIKGSVGRTSNSLVVNSGSAVGFEYNYNTGNNILKAQKLLFSIKVMSSNSDDISRYNENISITLRVQYYKKEVDSSGATTGYKDGKFRIFEIMPYLENETDGKIIEYTFDIGDEYIKQIYLEIDNNGDSQISLYDDSLYYSIELSKAVSDTMSFAVSLLGVSFYPNGFTLDYNGTDDTDKFYWNGDSNDELNGVDLNHEKLIYIKTHTELLD